MNEGVIENTPFKIRSIQWRVMPKFIGKKRLPDKNIVVGLIVPTNNCGMHGDDPQFDFDASVAIQTRSVETVVTRKSCGCDGSADARGIAATRGRIVTDLRCISSSPMWSYGNWHSMRQSSAPSARV